MHNIKDLRKNFEFFKKKLQKEILILILMKFEI